MQISLSFCFHAFLVVLGHFGDNRDLWNRIISRATESCVYHSPCVVLRISVILHICVQVSMSNSRRKYGAIPKHSKMSASGQWLSLAEVVGRWDAIAAIGTPAFADGSTGLSHPTAAKSNDRLNTFERCLPSKRSGRRKLLSPHVLRFNRRACHTSVRWRKDETTSIAQLQNPATSWTHWRTAVPRILSHGPVFSGFRSALGLFGWEASRRDEITQRETGDSLWSVKRRVIFFPRALAEAFARWDAIAESDTPAFADGKTGLSHGTAPESNDRP